MPIRDFSAVYDEHVWQVYGFFAYRLSARADAEDLIQQTFERALKAWARYDASRASVSTWLLVIARNLLTDQLRADRSSRQRPLDELEGEQGALVASPDRPDLGLEPDLEHRSTPLRRRLRSGRVRHRPAMPMGRARRHLRVTPSSVRAEALHAGGSQPGENS